MLISDANQQFINYQRAFIHPKLRFIYIIQAVSIIEIERWHKADEIMSYGESEIVYLSTSLFSFSLLQFHFPCLSFLIFH